MKKIKLIIAIILIALIASSCGSANVPEEAIEEVDYVGIFKEYTDSLDLSALDEEYLNAAKTAIEKYTSKVSKVTSEEDYNNLIKELEENIAEIKENYTLALEKKEKYQEGLKTGIESYKAKLENEITKRNDWANNGGAKYASGPHIAELPESLNPEAEKILAIYKDKLDNAEKFEDLQTIYVEFCEQLMKLANGETTILAEVEDTVEIATEPVEEVVETAPVVETPVEAPAQTVQSTQPAHEHSWKHVDATYATVHHDAVYENIWVEDKAAWSEEVLVKDAWDETISYTEYVDGPVHYFCGGQEFDTYEALDAYIDRIFDECILVVEDTSTCPPTNYSSYAAPCPVERTEIVHHDAEYQTVYHDAEGHYESKLVQNAWDETVTTANGYDVCATCGAIR